MVDRFDPIRVKDQLGKPDNQGLFVNAKPDTLETVSGPTFIIENQNGNSALWRVSTWRNANWRNIDPTSSGGIKYVVSPNNQFYWDFTIASGTEYPLFFQNLQIGITDLTNSTATEDTTTNYRVDFTGTQVWRSISIAKRDTPVFTTATLNLTKSGTFTYEMSANGGSNWETGTLNEQHTFSNTGTDLRLRITESASGTGWIKDIRVNYG